MRLDKYLTDAGVAASRKASKELLKKKQVTVDGKRVTDGKVQVIPEQTRVELAGEPIVLEELVYYMLYKPQGVVSATEDRVERTVLDLFPETLPQKKNVFPVGRLDKDTTGLLLVTNDGALAHSMLSPKKHVAKWYQATIAGCVTATDQERFAEGVILGNGEACLPAQLVIDQVDTDKQRSHVRVELKEGKYHQVKRMFAACGHHVAVLHRLSMGPLLLDPDLAPGEFRELRSEERQELGIESSEKQET